MIITCPFDKKQFKIDDNLIPDKGRMVQCGSCGHKWFFSKNTNFSDVSNKIDLNFSNEFDTKNEIQQDNADFKSEEVMSNITIHDNSENENYNKELKNKKDQINKVKSLDIFNLFKYLVVVIISVVGIILILDTFKTIIINIIPNIEGFLNSLYETLTDLKLFLKDLLN